MRFLPGAKVSEEVMIPDLGHCRGAGWDSGYALEPWSLAVHTPNSDQSHLGDLGQAASFLPQEALHL